MSQTIVLRPHGVASNNEEPLVPGSYLDNVGTYDSRTRLCHVCNTYVFGVSPYGICNSCNADICSICGNHDDELWDEDYCKACKVTYHLEE